MCTRPISPRDSTGSARRRTTFTLSVSRAKMRSICKAAISQHQQKPKHKENAKAANTTRALSNFLPSRSAPSTNDDKTAAAEGAWAFHVATHNQAFSSTDCCSSDALFRTMFSDSEVAKKFGCGRDKTQAILKGVLAPYSVECLLKELGEQPFSIFSIMNNRELRNKIQGGEKWE